MSKERAQQSPLTLHPLTPRAQSLKPACVTGRVINHSVSRLLIRTYYRDWGRQGPRA